MNDTPAEVQALYLRMLMSRSGSERVHMGASMFDTARAFMKARMRDEGLVEGTVEWQMALLDRTYGREISPEVRRGVEGRLRQVK